MDLMHSPIAVFLYNRPDKSYNCLKSLSQNHDFHDSDLYIFIDGPKSINDKKQIEDVKKVVADFEFKNLKKVQVSSSRLHNEGWRAQIGLKEGIIKTNKIFLEQEDEL
jgi:hypothetical protein